jgi:hypothetical protein
LSGTEKSHEGGLDVAGLKRALNQYRSSMDMPELPRALVVHKPVNAAMGKLSGFLVRQTKKQESVINIKAEL